MLWKAGYQGGAADEAHKAHSLNPYWQELTVISAMFLILA